RKSALTIGGHRHCTFQLAGQASCCASSCRKRDDAWRNQNAKLTQSSRVIDRAFRDFCKLGGSARLNRCSKQAQTITILYYARCSSDRFRSRSLVSDVASKPKNVINAARKR